MILQCITQVELGSRWFAELGIYKKNKKVRKQELDQESDQENKKTRKKEKLSFFLDHFLGRVLVFLFYYFLVFFHKFPPQGEGEYEGGGKEVRAELSYRGAYASQMYIKYNNQYSAFIN